MNFISATDDKTFFHDFTTNIFVDLFRRLFIMYLSRLLALGLLFVLSYSAYDWTAVENAVDKAIN